MREYNQPDTNPYEEGCKPRGLNYVYSLLIKIFSNPGSFFDKQLVLNSDGRRILRKAAKAAVSFGCRALGSRLMRALRDPTLDNILRAVEHYDEELASMLFDTFLDTLDRGGAYFYRSIACLQSQTYIYGGVAWTASGAGYRVQKRSLWAGRGNDGLSPCIDQPCRGGIRGEQDPE